MGVMHPAPDVEVVWLFGCRHHHQLLRKIMTASVGRSQGQKTSTSAEFARTPRSGEPGPRGFSTRTRSCGQACGQALRPDLRQCWPAALSAADAAFYPVSVGLRRLRQGKSQAETEPGPRSLRRPSGTDRLPHTKVVQGNGSEPPGLTFDSSIDDHYGAGHFECARVCVRPGVKNVDTRFSQQPKSGPTMSGPHRRHQHSGRILEGTFKCARDTIGGRSRS
jgi:hypothetical protein